VAAAASAATSPACRPSRVSSSAPGARSRSPRAPVSLARGPRSSAGAGQAAQQQQAGLVGAVQVVDQQQQRPGDGDRLQQPGERLEQQIRVGAGGGGGRQGGQPPGQLGPEPDQLGRPGAEQGPQPFRRVGGQVAADRLPQRQVGDAQVLVAASGQHDPAVGLGQAGQLGGQPGLADAGLAGHQHGPAPAAPGVGPGRVEPAQLRPPAHEGPRGQAAGRLGSGRRLVGRLGVEQLQVGGLQVGGRPHPQLLGQHPAVAVIGPQGLAPVAGGGMGQQQPPVGRVPERLKGDQVAGRADRVGGLPGRQVGLDEQLQAPDQDLVEGRAPVLDPGAVVAGQQGPPGDGPGPAGRGQRLGRPAGGQRPPGLGGLALGQLDVDRRVAGQHQPVAAGRAGEGGGRGQAEQVEEAPDPAHHPAQGGPPGRREGPAPDGLGQLLGRHRPVTFGHQVGEDHRRLPSRQVGGIGPVAVGLGRQLAGEGDLQRHRIAATLRIACVLPSTVSRAVNSRASAGFGRAGSDRRTRRTVRRCSPPS
jgi:hypothetical protein